MLTAGSDKVIVERDEERQTEGGIYIPDTAVHDDLRNPRRTGRLATVMAAGGRYEPGQRVYVPDFGGIEIKHEGLVLFVYQADDVLGVVTDGRGIPARNRTGQVVATGKTFPE